MNCTAATVANRFTVTGNTTVAPLVIPLVDPIAISTAVEGAAPSVGQGIAAITERWIARMTLKNALIREVDGFFVIISVRWWDSASVGLGMLALLNQLLT